MYINLTLIPLFRVRHAAKCIPPKRKKGRKKTSYE
jgi:hypothetical protein